MLSKRTILLHLVNLQLYSTLNHHIYLYNVFLVDCFIFTLSFLSVYFRGENVRLHVQGYAKLNNIEDLKWTFNKSHTLVKYSNESSTVKVYTKYQGRIEFSEANFSLVLKNLQEGDSGLYDAGVSGEENKDVAKYQISVQERVVTPVLTVNSVSSINGNCNVTVTCRGQNTSVTSSCNSSTCSQVGGESRGAETSTVPLLSVYVAGGFIICNHSNQISWAPNMKEIETICASNSSKTRTHIIEQTQIHCIYLFEVVKGSICSCCIHIWTQFVNKANVNKHYNTVGSEMIATLNNEKKGESYSFILIQLQYIFFK
uniref:Immunoglobulin V-set domain-containing protein n=1 Tax=Oncorhynchus mykiss TaxID=8022 RepID=A0A8C7S7Q0_ONCMY